MLALLLVWIYIYFILLGCGLATFQLLKRVLNWEEAAFNLALDELLLTGFISLTTFLAYFHLFFRIHIEVHLFVSILAACSLFFFKTHLQMPFIDKIALKKHLFTYFGGFCTFVLLLSLCFSIRVNDFYDTGLYHAQAMKWMETYKIVPGLANLHIRFAFNSHFLLPSTFFRLGFLHLQTAEGLPIVFYPLNSFFYFMFLIRCFYEMYKSLIHKTIYIYIFISVLLFFVFYYILNDIQSSSTDILPFILTFYLLLIAFKRANGQNTPFQIGLFIAIIVFLPTIKLSSTYICFLLLRCLKQFKTILGLSCLICLPFFGSNLMLSGTLFFPLHPFSWLPLDWQTNDLDISEVQQAIIAWARFSGLPPATVLQWSYKTWLPLWFLPQGAISKLLYLLNVLSPVVWLCYYRWLGLARNGLIFPLLTTIGLLFFLGTAPDPRFFYGLLLINAALMVALPFHYVGRLQPYFYLKPHVILLLPTCILLKIFYTTLKDNALELFWVLPCPTQKITTTVSETANGFPVFKTMPKYDQCFECELPCTHQRTDKIEQRSSYLGDGFRVKKQ